MSDDVNSGTLVFQSEFTGRDREHIREPPRDGFFIFGVHLWGCSSDKNAVEHGVSDGPARNREPCSSLPVIHLTCVPSEKAVQLATQQQSGAEATSNSRATSLDTYSTPLFYRRSTDRHPSTVICEIDLWKKTNNSSQTSRWAWRGVCMTAKPY